MNRFRIVKVETEDSTKYYVERNYIPIFPIWLRRWTTTRSPATESHTFAELEQAEEFIKEETEDLIWHHIDGPWAEITRCCNARGVGKQTIVKKL